MKVHVAFILLQIAGLLGTATAQESISEQNVNSTLIRKFLSNHRRDLNVTVMESMYLGNSESAKMKCETNGGPKALDTAIEGLRIGFNSIIATINSTQLQFEKADNQSNNGLDSDIEIACHWATNMDNIGRNLTKSIRPCWTPVERKSMDLMNNASTAVLQHVCQNRGQRISAFLNADGVRCVRSMMQNNEIGRCLQASSFSIETIVHVPKYDSTVNPPWSFPVFLLNTEICRGFEDVQRCIVAASRRCEYSTPADEMNSLLDILKETLGCESLLRPHVSPEQEIESEPHVVGSPQG